MAAFTVSLTAEQKGIAARNFGLCTTFASKYSVRFRPLSKEEIMSAAQFGMVRAAALWEGDPFDREFALFAWSWMQWYARNDQKKLYAFVSRYMQFSEDIDVVCPEDDEEDFFDWRAAAEKLAAVLDKMKPKNREMVELLLSGVGISEIARRIGCSKQNVSLVVRRELTCVSGQLGRLPCYVTKTKRTESTP